MQMVNKTCKNSVKGRFLPTLASRPIVLSPETITIHEFFISLQRESQMYKHIYVHIPPCFLHLLDFLNNSVMRYNLHTLKFTPLKFNVFCIPRDLCNHHHCLTPEYFAHPPNKPSILQQSFPISPTSPLPLSLESTNLLSVSMDLSALDVSRK